MKKNSVGRFRDVVESIMEDWLLTADDDEVIFDKRSCSSDDNFDGDGALTFCDDKCDNDCGGFIGDDDDDEAAT